MPDANTTDTNIIARGEFVWLRKWQAGDCDQFVRWMSRGEWRQFDAPWEEFRPAETPEDDRRNGAWFLEQLGRQDRCWLSGRAVITTLDDIPIGWVSRYGGQDGPGVIFVGIDICEDGFLNRGLGTEALKLWVDHLFAAWDYHRIGLDTWSFNPRMIRVAEKVGFVYEGRRRRMRHWQGEWLDSVHFGLLREEWQCRG